MANHSSVLAWRIPGTEPGRLPSLGSQSQTRLKRLSSSSSSLLKAVEKDLSMPLPSLPVAADYLWQSLTCSRIALISTCHHVGFSCLFCGYVLISSYQDTNHIRFRVHPNPAWPVLTQLILSAKTLFQNKVPGGHEFGVCCSTGVQGGMIGKEAGQHLSPALH